MQSLLLVLGLALLPAFAIGDTPANCTYEDARGRWSFSIGPKYINFNPSVDVNKPFATQTKWTVDLLYPDRAVDQNGNIGFWTMIYNQGFELVINERKFFGFFRYIQSSSDPQTVVSICNSTAPSWSHDVLVRQWASYTAVKIGSAGDKLTFRPTEKISLLPASRFLPDRMYRTNPDFIDEINSKQSLWRATVYPEFEKLTLQQITLRKGGPASTIASPVKASQISPELSKMVSTLPDKFDWRSVGGVNYVSPVRNQGSCGSCYSFASAAMLEARFRIRSNNTVKPILSPQDVVECSSYSQGCSGGFPYLIAGKYAQDFGMASEVCNPYKGIDGKCSTKANCTRFFATNYRYVGGYYGAGNEEMMKLALVHGGPLAIGFMVYDDFMHYKGGVYRHTGLTDHFNPFELTNHAVLLVGYGVDSASGAKYWSVKNSWGTTWGETGYFRILRGSDECAVESMPVSAEPIL